MNKSAAILFAALLSMGAAARAAEFDFDGVEKNGYESILDLVTGLEDKGHKPPPPQYHPVNPPGHNNHTPGHNNHHNPPPKPPKPPKPPQPTYPHHPPQPTYPHHPPVPPPYHPPSPPPPQYHFGGYERSCQTLTFTSQSPLSVTKEMFLREYGEECESYGHGSYNYNYHGYCRPTSSYHKRKVTINIGPRQLESWETERLEVCMEAPKRVTVDTSNMLYHYSVNTKNEEGFLGLNRRTTITLNPGAKKPSVPSSGELTVAYAGLATSGDMRLVLNDARADFFRGERISISVDGMRLPGDISGLPVDQVLASFNNFKTSAMFDVARSYEMTLTNRPVPGKYVLTIKFRRLGVMSTGAEATLIETVEIR